MKDYASLTAPLNRVLAICISMLLVAALAPLSAVATPLQTQEDEGLGVPPVAGTNGGCDWSIDENGKLVITESADGDGVLALSEDLDSWPWPWLEYSEYITTATVGANVSGDASHMFEDCKNLVSVDIKGLVATNAYAMFGACKALTSVDLSGLDVSQVEDMTSMFGGCQSLETLDVSSFDTSNATSMHSMFSGMDSLKELDLSKFNTSKVTHMGGMFTVSYSLEALDLSSFDTSQVIDMGGMFQECLGLKTLDLSSFDSSKVTNMEYMFSNCRSLKELDLPSSFDTSQAIRMKEMFANCRSLKELDLSSFDTSQALWMDDMFANCTLLEKVALGTKFSFKSGCTLPGEWWRSTETGTDFTAVQIASERNAVADTYLRASEPTMAGQQGGAVWQPGSNESVSFRSSAPLGEFEDVLMDGETVPMTENVESGDSMVERVNYTVREGSTIVELAPEYLATLPEGEHEVGIKSSYGIAKAILTVQGDANAPDDPTTPDTDVAMYRLYNPNSGEHFYTASEAERDHLKSVGWQYEGTAWTAPKKSDTPVYRLYSGTDHHYTASAAERDHLKLVGWSDEGIGWYSDDSKGVVLYRLFNPNVDPGAATNNSGSHHYTVSAAERDHLKSLGWSDEGEAWHGVK